MTFLVEYQPDSLWYETSLSIAAESLTDGVKTQYHCFIYDPPRVRESLQRLGADPRQKEHSGLLVIFDSYTPQIGIGAPEWPDQVTSRSLKTSDWSIAVGQEIKRVHDDSPMDEHLHIDDSFSVLLQYNDEKSVIDLVRTRSLPMTRSSKRLWFLSLATGIASESFYRQLELLCDGILDFKSEESDGERAHYVRVRTIRGKPFDSRWRELQVSEDGQVTFVE